MIKLNEDLINQFIGELTIMDNDFLQDGLYEAHPHLEESNDEFLELFYQYEKVALSRMYKKEFLIELIELIDKNN